jgi:LAO/AO transport system kinase
MLLCEAAGFDRVLVETVGVGQSELLTAGMVDTFLLLVQPGAGDELQGIKRGIVERADLLAVTKADGATAAAAREAAAEYGAALRYGRSNRSGWQPRVVVTSARTGDGIEELADLLEAHREAGESSGELAARRHRDLRDWLLSLAREELLERWLVGDRAARLEALAVAVGAGERSALEAARELL